MVTLAEDDDGEIDLTKLRYVLYARRSSEDKSKQVRSLGDQIKDCREFADHNHLHIVGKPLQEKKSAKRAGQRKLFDQMLKDIRAKKYNAILAWAPDRLSRNMLEGGKLIDMLDEGELQDMRFVTHHFTNDPTGKLTLGIMFSISKHFSDDLSRKVSRGVRGNLSEGKSSGTPKWGYDRDDVTGLYTPNKYFNIVQNAWFMRGDGHSCEEVCKYLLDKDYHRVTKDKGKKNRIIKPTMKSVSIMFHDPFYYGKLMQANQTVDLREVVYDFEPMIEEDLYNKVQTLGYGRTKDQTLRKRAVFYPLRRFVFCGVCNSPKYMLVGKNRSHTGVRTLSYRCDNKNCARRVKSFRAKYIFKSIADTLSTLRLSDEAYDRYSKQIDQQTDTKLIAIKETVHSQRGALAHIKREIKEIGQALLMHDTTSNVYKINKERMDALEEQQVELEVNIQDLSDKIVDPTQIKVTKSEFLNLLKTAPDKMKAGSAIEKDALCRILFLNLWVDNEKVCTYLWREPFRSLVETAEITSGGDERT